MGDINGVHDRYDDIPDTYQIRDELQKNIESELSNKILSDINHYYQSRFCDYARKLSKTRRNNNAVEYFTLCAALSTNGDINKRTTQYLNKWLRLSEKTRKLGQLDYSSSKIDWPSTPAFLSEYELAKITK